VNNTIVLDAPQEATVLENDGCKTLRIQNNVFVRATGTYWAAPPGPGTLTLDHNPYFGASAAPSEDAAPIVKDPLFVNHAGHAFHLAPGSPARDTGVATSIATDFDGTLRPQGAAFDIGAYEA